MSSKPTKRMRKNPLVEEDHIDTLKKNHDRRKKIKNVESLGNNFAGDELEKIGYLLKTIYDTGEGMQR